MDSVIHTHRLIHNNTRRYKPTHKKSKLHNDLDLLYFIAYYYIYILSPNRHKVALYRV